MKTLYLNVKKEFFDQIKIGAKKEEYRIVKPYWVNRLVGKHYDFVEFANGYSKNAPKVTLEYKGYEIKNRRSPFFGNEEVTVFAIKLGSKITHK